MNTQSTPTQPRADASLSREQSGEAAHTPTPWVIDENGIVTPDDMAQSLNEDAGTPREWVAIGVNDEEGFAECVAYTHPTNAAFIVRACNSHARLTAELAQVSAENKALREALQKAICRLECSNTMLGRKNSADDDLRDALAASTGTRSASESSTNTEGR